MIAQRVAKRWVGRKTSAQVLQRYLRLGATIGDPHELVRKFEDVVDFLAELEPRLSEMRAAEESLRTDKSDWSESDQGVLWRKSIMAFVVRPSSAYNRALRAGAGSLFLAILQQYYLPVKIRKVIERGSKTFSRSSMRKAKPAKALTVYTKTLKAWRDLLDAAKQALIQGKEHAEGEGTTKFPAGPFTLVNTGGFGDDVMKEVVKVVTTAAQLLTTHGFKRVCYGDILVSNTIDKSSRTLAFYLIGKDEMFVRANLKGKKSAAVETVIHELGHRLHYKFLKSKDREIRSIYARLSGDDAAVLEALENDKANHPKIGDTIIEGLKKYEVTGMGFNRRYKRVVHLSPVGNPGSASIPLSGWLRSKGMIDQTGSFVSRYAQTSYAENFAEMVYHYCADTLPEEQVEMLEAVL